MKKNKKTFGKNPVEPDDDNDDDLGDYQAINSDDDDSDGILDKLNEESEESSEEEVLPIHSDSESEDEGENEGDHEEDEDDLGVSDSDIDNPEDDLPSSKAWGKKAKNFYDTNRIDSKKKLENEEEEELAKMEEMEAMTIQQRLLGELEDVDLSLDLMTSAIAAKQAKEEDQFIEKDKVVVDLSQMSEADKKNLLKKESPELFTYIDDYKRLMACINDELLPVLSKLKDESIDRSSAAEFIKIFYQLIMNYCTNITFYFLLKARKMDTASHPVSRWISKYKELLKESEPIYSKVIKSQIQTIMNESEKSKMKGQIRKITTKKSTIKKKIKSVDENDSVDAKTDEKLTHLYNEFSESDDDAKESKRPITYQIAKNKGLTPHRKKELRNPRVKHRMKFRKAKIRRKGQVRESRPEIQKYAGEISGIKANVVKSVKFRV